ncbi:MAG: hypothetical protein M3Q07_07995, partial [Pseudobdellovibrionaceae bacterium]|nr:hypothetical protein [Pseudobdellovibrionaceae bacterium]
MKNKSFDKTTIAIAGISFLLIAWLYGRNPASLTTGTGALVVIAIILQAFVISRGIKAAKARGERIFTPTNFLILLPALLLAGYVNYYFKQAMKVSDAKLAIFDLHATG